MTTARHTCLAALLICAGACGKTTPTAVPIRRAPPPVTTTSGQAVTPTDDELSATEPVPEPLSTEVEDLPTSPTAIDFATAPAVSGDALIWHTTGMRPTGPTEETVWVSLAPDRPAKILARRPGLWAAAGAEIWGLHRARRRLPICDPARCALDDTDCTRVPAQASLAATDDLTWIGLTTRKSIKLTPRLADSTALDLVATDLAQVVEPLALLGDRLVLRVTTRYSPCGHTEERLLTSHVQRRIPRGMAEVLASPGEEAGLVATDALGADAWFSAEHGRTLGETRWVTVHQRLSPQGGWILEHQFARQAEQGRGDGETATGEVSVRAPVRRLPQALALLAVQAPHLQGLNLSLDPGDGGHAGWSWLQPSGADRDALLQAFQNGHGPP